MTQFSSSPENPCQDAPFSMRQHFWSVARSERGASAKEYVRPVFDSVTVSAFHGLKNQLPSFSDWRQMRASACRKSTASSMTSCVRERPHRAIMAAEMSFEAQIA